jgi:predicted DNA-binding transcriptional regulator
MFRSFATTQSQPPTKELQMLNEEISGQVERLSQRLQNLEGYL